MFFKKMVNKFFFDKNGYALLKTNLKNNLKFNKLCIEIESVCFILLHFCLMWVDRRNVVNLI